MDTDKDYYNTEDTISDTLNLNVDRDNLLKYLIKNVSDEFKYDKYESLLIYNVSAGFSQSNPPLLLKYRNKEYILRKCSDSVIGDPSPLIGFKKQYKIMSILYKYTNIPVPKLYHFCSDKTILGKEFYIMQFLKGRIFLNKTVFLPNMTNKDRKEIYFEINKLMANLHCIDIDKIGLRKYLEFDENNYWKSPKQWTIKSLLNQFNSSLINCDINKEYKIKSYFDKMNNYKIENNKKLTIIHGDIHFENIIFDLNKNKIIALVDWETCSIGNPLFDLTYFNHRWHWKYIKQKMSFSKDLIPLNWSGFIHLNKKLTLNNIGIPTETQFIQNYIDNICINHNGNNILNKYNIIYNINNHYNYFSSLQIYRLLSIFYKLHKSKEKQFEKLLNKFPIVVVEYFTINGLNVLHRPNFIVNTKKLNTSKL